MGKKGIIKLVVLVLIAGLTTNFSFAIQDTTGKAAEEPVTVHVLGTDDYNAANEVVELVNDTRAAFNLKPIILSEDLTEAAMQRAAETCITYSNDFRPDGTPSNRISDGLDTGIYIELNEFCITTAEAFYRDCSNNDAFSELATSDKIKSAGIGHFIDDLGYEHWTIILDDEIRTPQTRTGRSIGKRAVKALPSRLNSVLFNFFAGPNFKYGLESMNMTAQTKVGARYPDVVIGRAIPLDVADFNFSSSDKTVAVVDGSGTVKPIGGGETTITASLKENPEVLSKGMIKVEKADPVLQISQSPNLQVGKPYKINVKSDSDGKVTYTSMNPDIATVSEDGFVTFNRAGEVGITISLAESHNYKGTSMTARYSTSLDTIIVKESDSITRYVGNEAFYIKPDLPGEIKITYESTDPQVAKIGETGIVTILKAGSTQIRMVIYDLSGNLKDTMTVNLTVNKKASEISAKNYRVTYGSKKTFFLNAISDRGASLTYCSMNPKIVKVSSEGKATIVRPGKVSIKITSPSTDEFMGAKKIITITVQPKKAALSKVTALGSKRIKVTWNGDSTVDGCQILYAKDKNFTKGCKYLTIDGKRNTSKIISKLTRGKTYYFKVRSYKKNGSQKIYGSWSTYRYKKCR